MPWHRSGGGAARLTGFPLLKTAFLGFYLPMPSLRDVAKDLGVSVSLVSKVLNNRLGTTGVRGALVEQIHEAAERLGYRKNFNAVSLFAGRQNSIAVMVHSHGTQGSGLVEKLLDGISQATRSSSQRITLDFFETDEEFRSRAAKYHSGLVDGILVTGVMHPGLKKDLLKIHRSEIPVVTVYNEPLHKELINIGIPNDALSEAATTHLIDQGCRRILHLEVLSERAAGHRRALRNAGLPSDPSLVVKLPAPEGFRVEPCHKAFCEILDSGLEFDGVSAQSDAQAATIINELTRRGVSVPSRVKVVGIDNAPFCDFWIVPITSVSQLFVERGKRAVQSLSLLVEGQTVASQSLRPEIRLRGSSAT